METGEEEEEETRRRGKGGEVRRTTELKGPRQLHDGKGERAARKEPDVWVAPAGALTRPFSSGGGSGTYQAAAEAGKTLFPFAPKA